MGETADGWRRLVGEAWCRGRGAAPRAGVQAQARLATVPARRASAWRVGCLAHYTLLCRVPLQAYAVADGADGVPGVPRGRSREHSRAPSVAVSSAASTPAKGLLPGVEAALLHGLEMEFDTHDDDASPGNTSVAVSDCTGGTLSATVRDGAVCIDFGDASPWLLAGLAAAGAGGADMGAESLGVADSVAAELQAGGGMNDGCVQPGLVQNLQQALCALEEQQDAARLQAIAALGEVYGQEADGRVAQLLGAARAAGSVADVGSDDDEEGEASAYEACAYNLEEWVDLAEAARKTEDLLAQVARAADADSSDE